MNNYFAGVDGCRCGWCVVQLDRNHAWHIHLVENINTLAPLIETSVLTLIDIPIGLLDNDGPQRECDQQARRVLGMPRASSVFPAPSRTATYAASYEQACSLNQQRLGRKLSKQSWNIAAKIREIDELLLKQKHLATKLRESHPEVCFWALNNKIPMRFNKKKPSGHEERLALLAHYLPQARDILEAARVKYSRKDLAVDDILDAIVLAVAAQLGNQNLHTLPVDPPKDRQNLTMEITYPDAALLNCQL